ncbi:free fatty acid receptor 1-like [Discoglossus pictus]
MSWEILSLVVYVMTIFLGLPSNILAFYIFCKKARIKLTPNLIYMINICISDLVFIMVLPIKISETFLSGWTLPPILCPIYNFCHFSTIYASVCFLSAVSVGRYLSVAFPIKYKIYKKPKYSCMICVCLWAIVLVHVAIVFFLETTQNGSLAFFINIYEGKQVCYENFTDNQLNVVLPVRLELSIVLFFVPLIITTFSYVSCIRILMRSYMHRKYKKKAIRVAVTTLTIFIVCFAPYNISHIVGFVTWTSVSWRKQALLPSTCNAFLDPLIFYFLSASVNQGFYHTWKSLQLKYRISVVKFSSIFKKEQQEMSERKVEQPRLEHQSIPLYVKMQVHYHLERGAHQADIREDLKLPTSTILKNNEKIKSSLRGNVHAEEPIVAEIVDLVTTTGLGDPVTQDLVQASGESLTNEDLEQQSIEEAHDSSDSEIEPPKQLSAEFLSKTFQ